MRPLPALLAALALLTAGCLADDAADDEGGDGPAAGEAAARQGFFTADMGLADAPEADASAVRSGSFFQAWAEGTDYPTWESAAFDEDVAVENLTATLYVRATGPVVETVRFPDIMIYAGAGGAFMGFASAKVASILVPGEVHEVPLNLSAPHGGLVIPAGERLAFKVVPVMHQNEQADVEILVGGKTASHAAWTERAVALPDVALEHGDAEGELAGSAYAGAAAPESTRHQTVVTTSEVPRAFLVWMNTTGHAGVPDIDLALVAPSGEEVASSGTPTPREFLRIAAPNLREQGDYTIVVASYGSARATFTVEWQVG